ncbi:MAG: DUF1648 domain-containing protein [Tissierellia bacterium]|nr:DUF1648 domain-containing protein [Tissierellia bacterium]
MNLYIKLSLLGPILFMGIIQMILPKMGSKGTLMGVDLPKKEQEVDEIKHIIRTFQILVLLTTLATAGFLWFFLPVSTENKFVGMFLIILVLFMIIQQGILIWVNKKLIVYKKSQNIKISGVDKKVVSMELTKKPYKVERFSMKLYWIPVLFVIAFGIITIIQYPKIPSQIPTHYGINGPDAWTEKNIFTVFIPIILGFIQVFIFYIVHRFFLREKKSLNPNLSEESYIRWKISRRYWSYYYFFIAMGTVITLLYPHLWGIGLLEVTKKTILIYNLIIGIFIALLILVSIILGIKVGNTGSRLNLPFGEEDDAFEDEDDYWYLGGTVYYNPDDPAMIIPKRVGIGTTINAGTRAGKIVYAITVIVLLGLFVYGLYLYFI